MSFWRTEDPLITTSNVLVKGGMFDHQRQWWQSQSFIKALVTGYGGGKTHIGGKRAIAVSLENSGIPYLVVSPTYKMARKTVIPTIKELLIGKKTLLRDFQWKFHKADFEFVIKYHGRTGIIWIQSGEDPDALKGPNICAGWIDEPFIQHEDVFTQTIARIRHPAAKIKELGLTGTPEQLNWGYDLCKGKGVGKTKFDIETIQASTRKNKALTPDYVDRLESALTEKAAEAYIEGKFVSLAKGLVYYGFSDANVCKLPDPGHELGWGVDFNVNPMAAVVFWTNGNHLHFIKEYEEPNADTEYMCDLLREEWGDRLNECYPDASGRSRHTSAPGGRSDFYYIEKAGFDINCKSVNPKRRDRYNAVNGKLRPKGSPPTVTMDPQCEKLQKYMQTYTHELMQKQKHMSHLLDAAGYPVAYLYPVQVERRIEEKLLGV